MEAQGIQRQLKFAHTPQQNGKAEQIERTLLSLCVTTFLSGDLEEEVFMEVTSGFHNSRKLDLEGRLQKALHGLKQAPAQWYGKIHELLTIELQYTRNPHEPCVYVSRTGSSVSIIMLYKDDLLIAGISRDGL